MFLLPTQDRTAEALGSVNEMVRWRRLVAVGRLSRGTSGLSVWGGPAVTQAGGSSRACPSDPTSHHRRKDLTFLAQLRVIINQVGSSDAFLPLTPSDRPHKQKPLVMLACPDTRSQFSQMYSQFQFC